MYEKDGDLGNRETIAQHDLQPRSPWLFLR